VHFLCINGTCDNPPVNCVPPPHLQPLPFLIDHNQTLLPAVFTFVQKQLSLMQSQSSSMLVHVSRLKIKTNQRRSERLLSSPCLTSTVNAHARCPHFPIITTFTVTHRGIIILLIRTKLINTFFYCERARTFCGQGHCTVLFALSLPLSFSLSLRIGLSSVYQCFLSVPFLMFDQTNFPVPDFKKRAIYANQRF
jgi:hypothetical protein